MDKDILLFDLDGTLTDPKVGITRSVAFALDKAGIHVENPDDLCAFIGPPLKDMFMELYSFDEAQALQAIADYRVYFRKQGMLENVAFVNCWRHCRSRAKRFWSLPVSRRNSPVPS